ncbi:MAG TPA: hypothetical protein VM364_13055 [Vicinamibacterales bacterium]|nr:hypothetical protein [Vicinamibacterales bacterium]
MQTEEGRRELQHSIVAGVAFLLLSIAWTWPLATRLSTRIAHDPGDPVLNAWILWWNTQAVPFTARWWSPEFFHPAPGALALSEHLAGIALLSAPLHFAGLNPAAVYNVTLIVVCWLSAVFAFLLGRRLTGSALGGVVCGVAFGFAPYRAGQLAHLQVLAAQWMPLALLAMHAYVADGRRRWLVLFAAAWLLQALSNGYYLLFFPLLVALWLLWFGEWRHRIALAATFAGASLLLLPALLKYREVHAEYALSRTFGEMLMFSARLKSFVQAPDLLAFWPTLSGATPEGYLFPGITVSVLVAAGACAAAFRGRLRTIVASRSPALFYAAAAVIFWWLCFGPARSNTPAQLLSHPYSLLMWLPGFDGLRVPARFAMIATLCIAVAAAIAAVRLAPRRPRWRAAFAAMILAGLFVDTWLEAMPLAPLPSRFRVPQLPGAAVLELPPDDPAVGVAAMYRSIVHGRPLVNGFSGYSPPHHHVVSGNLRRGDASVLEYFAAGRPLIVLVHRNDEHATAWRALVEKAGGVLEEESGLGPVYVVPPQPPLRAAPPGAELPSTPHPAAGGYIAVDLGSVRTVRSIVVDLRWRHQEIGPDTLVEVSTDDVTWTTAWAGWIGGLSVAGAIEHQTLVPLRLTLPDVTARYIRVSPAAPRLGESLRVYAPR